jgi:hypothetical protein
LAKPVAVAGELWDLDIVQLPVSDHAFSWRGRSAGTVGLITEWNHVYYTQIGSKVKISEVSDASRATGGSITTQLVASSLYDGGVVTAGQYIDFPVATTSNANTATGMIVNWWELGTVPLTPESLTAKLRDVYNTDARQGTYTVRKFTTPTLALLDSQRSGLVLCPGISDPVSEADPPANFLISQPYALTTTVTLYRGIDARATVLCKPVIGIEFVALAGTPMSTFMTETYPQDATALDSISHVHGAMHMVYPARYNFLGLLSKIFPFVGPIARAIGSLGVPVISDIAKAIGGVSSAAGNIMAHRARVARRPMDIPLD